MPALQNDYQIATYIPMPKGRGFTPRFDKELQKDLREDVPHKVLYSSRGTRYYWLQENVLSFLRNRINIKKLNENGINKTPRIRGVLLFL